MSEEVLVITDPDTDRYHTFSYISWWKQDVVRDATALIIVWNYGRVSSM